MNLITLFYIALSFLIVPVGFSIYDVYRHKNLTAQILSEKERYSKMYHSAKAWTIFLMSLVLIFSVLLPAVQEAYKYVTITDLIYWIPASATLYWIVFDIYWNLKNDQHIFYPGDGYGGVIESFLYNVANLLITGNTNPPVGRWGDVYDMFTKVTVWAKMIAVFISTAIIFRYGIFW